MAHDSPEVRGDAPRGGPADAPGDRIMRILLATSEAVPFAKTGGLADVSGALPGALERLGHEPVVILPLYRAVRQGGHALEPTGVRFSVPIGSKVVTGSLLRATLPASHVPVYFVEQDDYFDREGLYGDATGDYIDNCERFVFFARAVIEAIRLLDLRPDVVHCNDWQTGLIPAYLKIEYRAVPGYESLASVLTIHNLAYQGTFWHWDMLLTGLDWRYFNWHQMEFYGKLNLLKTGLVFADALNTVSPRYAEEIQSAPLGCGLEGVLQQRRGVLSGIINGVDYGIWNPAIDPHLPVRYDASNWEAGKAACKQALQRELGLPEAPRTPLVGFVGRLVEQKGIDLVTAVLQEWVHSADLQWAILGTGDATAQETIATLAARFPHKVACSLKFSEALAHRIEAGADMFLMPSRYEPCGLSQLYSLKYGTAPIVRATGGLVDTVEDVTAASLAAGKATGFRFQEYSPLAMADTLRRAMDYYHRGDAWRQIIATGMAQDWSWDRSAREYVELYERTRARSARALECVGAG